MSGRVVVGRVVISRSCYCEIGRPAFNKCSPSGDSSKRTGQFHDPKAVIEKAEGMPSQGEGVFSRRLG